MLMVVSAGATVSAYSDVADEDAYAAAIAALTEWGIVNGTELGEAEDGSDALYEPDADVTRWQMALMMARTLAPEVEEEEWAEGMEIFGDVTEWKLYHGEWFYKSVFLYQFEKLHGNLLKPVVVRVENGKVSQVSLDMDIRLPFSLMPLHDRWPGQLRGYSL